MVGCLLTGCPVCIGRARESGGVWIDPGRRAATDTELEGILAGKIGDLRDEGRRAAREASAARLLFEEFRSIPADAQEEFVDATAGARTVSFCHELLDAAQLAGSTEPPQYLRLAELALRLINSLEGKYPATLVADLTAKARMHRASALKFLGDRPQAEAELDRAETLLERGSGDAFERARLLKLRATLRGTQRRYAEAKELARKAARSFEQLGEEAWAARCMGDRASYLQNEGNSARAAEALRSQLAHAAKGDDPTTVAVAHHNLAASLTDLGLLDEAEKHAAEARLLHEEMGRTTHLVRLRWVEGRIALARGQYRLAEEAFLEARNYFRDLDIGIEVANATLDLSLVYLHEGRWDDLRQAAALMLDVYQAAGIERESIAALKLFQQAVIAEELTLEFVSQLQSFLREAKSKPSLRFSPDV